jgi:hypothetical protein
MDPYMYKRNNEGIHIINVAKTWEKLMVAARIIAAVSNPRDVLVMSLIPTDFRLSLTESTPREPFSSSPPTPRPTTSVASGPLVL